MDVDARTCIECLNDAITRSGMTQAGFARALGTSGSRLSTYRSGRVVPSATFFLRAQRIARSLESTASRGWLSADATAVAVAEALLDPAPDRESWAFKLVVQGRDHLRVMLRDAPDLGGSWEAAPRGTGSRRWDVLLAALAGHEFDLHGTPPPTWTESARLPEPWLFPSPLLSADQVQERTASWLLTRNILLTDHDLTTA